MYEFNLTLNQSFDEAMASVRDALMSEHLGIVSEVDVQAVFANKIGKQIAPYRILGACNPKLADRVISAEPNAGVLLPCNVVVRAETDAVTVVSFLDPVAALSHADSDEPKAVADEARAMLDRVRQKLEGTSNNP
jgi:uncharacterized protein (DUF302 family)